ncbi:DNA methylase [Desulforhopalus vacuolatus]|uniref:DNA methyltransferase n=1 Tax=Desulforhopalus vacuolatus TaxID=40414 RepID=UPI001962E1AE|nr:DNA methyltransferase [Desulforhopalus vacuolatus]MBM9518325.1 DNA methylase [Desulforhopalus vacuolatus]
MAKQERLFKTKVVSGKPGSGNLFEEIVSNDGPVKCLGLEFENDEARRAHFTEELRKKLQDPEFRKIEGFPIGEDEDILNLSDPPYYTACPNPWIADFIEEWESQKPEKPADYHYHREPFAADVSEGKNDPIYNAHSYHTKVPHKAIMRYILHYTEPGDIVFDSFCGTGMTGVAAQMCGDSAEVRSLGYQITNQGTIKNGNSQISKLGSRKPVLSDLSSIATFISGTLNIAGQSNAFDKETTKIIEETEKQLCWMYETFHTDGKTVGKVNYFVWSEVFICPDCSEEFSFYKGSYNENTKKLSADLQCPHCNSSHKKRALDRAFETIYDTLLNKSTKIVKQIPVLINYSIGTKRYTKVPNQSDLLTIDKIKDYSLNEWFPSVDIPKIERFYKDGLHLININNTSQFYTKRNLIAAATIYKKFTTNKQRLMFTSFCERHIVKRNRWLPTGPIRPLNNTLYFPPLYAEVNVFNIAKRKWKDHKKAYGKIFLCSDACVTCQSSTYQKYIPNNSIDYIFTDPPFGWNLIYSELSFLWEAWLKLKTDSECEAIVNDKAEKDLLQYRNLITACFKENFRILKPGKWMTVEFHNSSNSVWISIQEALTSTGFIVADVKTIDKKQGSINQDYYRGGAVKQDLAISVYKPNKELEKSFQLSSGTENGVWIFTRNHLFQLPVFIQFEGNIKFIAERKDYLLYDRMIAYHVQHNVTIPISAAEFYDGLSTRFPERDGMYFLPEQVAEYDRRKMIGGGKMIQSEMWIKDEASAIEWLRSLLRDKPQSFQDINPLFMKEINGWSKNEVGLELSTLLEQNFLPYEGKGPVPDQIHSYLSTNWKDMRKLAKDDSALIAKAKGRWYVPDPNKTGDLEKLREKALLKEFEEYKESKKKLKIFRIEAVRAGFKKAWQSRDYSSIITVAEKIPHKILEEDSKLLMWYDHAVTRSEE